MSVSGDINQVFESISFAENTFSEAAFSEGHSQGLISGRQEGLLLGLDKGAEIGRELGFYQGFAEGWLHLLKTSGGVRSAAVISDKTVAQLQKLADSVSQFPSYNNRDTDVSNRLGLVRARFKQVCSLLKVKSELKEKSICW